MSSPSGSSPVQRHHVPALTFHVHHCRPLARPPPHGSDQFGAGAAGCVNGWVKCTFNLLWFLLPRYPILPFQAALCISRTCSHELQRRGHRRRLETVSGSWILTKASQQAPSWRESETNEVRIGPDSVFCFVGRCFTTSVLMTFLSHYSSAN